VVLAAASVPLGAVGVEATSITCGFGQSRSPLCFGSERDRRFLFGDYVLELRFLSLSLSAGFRVTVTDAERTQSDLAGRLAEGYRCVPLIRDSCIEFTVTGAPASGPDTWSSYYLEIDWFLKTDTDFPNAPGNRIRLLHNRGMDLGPFDKDITDETSYSSDPGIGGNDDSFSSFIVAQAPVPEPASLVLVATGISGLLYGRRRRRRTAAQDRP
jgi:hypothetical protein